MRSVSKLRGNIYEGVITQFSTDLQNGLIFVKSILHYGDDYDLLDIKRGTHFSNETPSSYCEHRFSVPFDASQVALLVEGDTTVSKVFSTNRIVLFLPVGLRVLFDAHEGDLVSQSGGNSNAKSQHLPMMESPIHVAAVYVHERNMKETPLSCCSLEHIFSSPFFSLPAYQTTLDFLNQWNCLDTYAWERWRQNAYTFIDAQQNCKGKAINQMPSYVTTTNRSSGDHIADIDAIPFD